MLRGFFFNKLIVAVNYFPFQSYIKNARLQDFCKRGMECSKGRMSDRILPVETLSEAFAAVGVGQVNKLLGQCFGFFLCAGFGIYANDGLGI